MVVLDTLLGDARAVLADGALSMQLHSVTSLSTQSRQSNRLPERFASYRDLRDRMLVSGVRLFLTNTFDAGRFQLRQLGLQHAVTQINEAAAVQLRRAFYDVDVPVAIVGNVSLASSAVTYSDQVAAVAEQVCALASGGVDLLWAESLTAITEIDALLEGCRLGAPQLDLIVTLAFRPNHANPFKMSPGLAAKRLNRNAQVIGVGVDTSRGDWRLEQSLASLKAAGVEKLLAAKISSDALAVDSSLDQDASVRAQRMARTVAQLGTRIIALDHNATAMQFQAVNEALNEQLVVPV